jgi:ADP-ribose pyrophosphatase YjhB (NUDIX family)
MKEIRNSIKAIIIREGKILLTKNKDKWGYFYLLPGGGQKHKENMVDALQRECLEEINSKVKIIDLVYVREYIGKNHEFAEWDKEVHQIEYMFQCDLKGSRSLDIGSSPDAWQEDIEWIPLINLKKVRLYPSILKDLITKKGYLNRDKIYLGDIN